MFQMVRNHRVTAMSLTSVHVITFTFEFFVQAEIMEKQKNQVRNSSSTSRTFCWSMTILILIGKMVS